MSATPIKPALRALPRRKLRAIRNLQRPDKERNCRRDSGLGAPAGRTRARLCSGGVRSGWISSEGRFIAEFERRWAAYCGVSHGVAVCNGTAALEAGNGGARRCRPAPRSSCRASPSSPVSRRCSASDVVPVLVDCEPDTWCLDVAEVERKITDQYACGHAGAYLRAHGGNEPARRARSRNSVSPSWRTQRKRMAPNITAAAPAASARWDASAFTPTRSSPPAKAEWS